MSDALVTNAAPATGTAPAAPAGFLRHAKVVGLLTLASRVLGLAREVVSAHYLGTGLVASAFTVAFTIPNLFRKLFGEGALSAAFIPLYAAAVRAERADGGKSAAGPAPRSANRDPNLGSDTTASAAPMSAGSVSAVSVAAASAEDAASDGVAAPAGAVPEPEARAAPAGSANVFAAAGVNLLVAILLGITLAGEAVMLAGMWLWPAGFRPDLLLALRLTAIMLPYVVLVCGTAFLSGVLQVHRRFAAAAAAPILLNVCHVGVLVVGARLLGLRGDAPGRDDPGGSHATLTYWLAGFVLVGGALQVTMLLPGLRAVGFRFAAAAGWLTPMTRRMLRLTVPVAVGAGVVQLSVLLDRGISILLMQGTDEAGRLIATHFTILGHPVRYPLEAGAPARLAVAQFMYLFPLGIFATALATAIFPSLSGEALERDRTAFRASVRQGIEAALWEGIPASVGLILVREPAVRLLFRHGQITAHDADLIAQSLLFYAGGIWAFSLLQIVGRAYYAVHDARTPLVMSVVNLAVNLAVELPLIWWLGEAGMAVGTLAAFALQAVLMVWLLDRRVGDLELARIAPAVGKMVIATALMAVACWGVQQLPVYPAGQNRAAWAAQLVVLIGVGAAVYLIACRAMNVTVMDQLLPRRLRRK